MRKKPRFNKGILVPALVSAALIALGIIIGDSAVLANLIIIAVFVFIVPFFLYKYSKHMWIKGIEEQFPNFVRDLADSTRSGMSLPESIGIASKSNYGKLTNEIQKMHNRLSWGTPFMRVLEIFSQDAKESKVMTEAVRIIKQSYESGGSISATLDAVAKDILMLKEAEAEKTSLVREQVMIMYGLFFIFVGISVMIIFVMVPMMASEEAMTGLSVTGFGFSNPCQDSGLIFPCGLFSGICVLFSITSQITCYYVAIFFSIVLIQGIFTGLIAGQLSENSAIAGSKHSLIMVFIAIGIFMFLSKVGFFPN
jgi:flagellar protein FlaJ